MKRKRELSRTREAKMFNKKNFGTHIYIALVSLSLGGVAWSFSTVTLQIDLPYPILIGLGFYLISFWILELLTRQGSLTIGDE